MRWNALVFALTMVLAASTGCAQRCFVNQKEFNDFHARNDLPLNLEVNNSLSANPTSDVREGAPAIVDDPDRDPRYISLAEVIAIALERGSTGVQSVRQPGNINEDLQPGLGTGGFQFVSSDSIRVLTLNPAVAGVAIDAALARFDAKWVTTMSTGTVDQVVQGFNSFTNGDQARFASSLVKPLPTGGIAGITFNTLYQNLVNPPTGFPLLNPAYTPRAQVTFEQPLWQSAGVMINQLMARSPQAIGTDLSKVHPEALSYLNGHLINVQNAGGASALNPSGILVSRTRFDQSRAELERILNFQLYNVEVAYWNLYGAYVNLYTTEQALRFGFETWKIARAKFQAGVQEYTEERLAQSRGQFEQFRGDRLQALGRVLEAERVLRSLLGLPPEDCHRLVPVDAPTLTQYLPCWEAALDEALLLRPELLVARAELRALQFNIMVQKNFLKPDLRMLANFGVNGLGDRLDGTSEVFDSSTRSFRPGDALRVLSGMHYNDWNVALTLNVPLGFRYEHASVRQAQLLLAQGFLAVKREEDKARLFLTKTYRDIFENYRVLAARRSQREAFAEQLRARDQKFRAGFKEATIEFVLQAQREWANALSQEYQAIVAYNNALAAFQFAKGTILQHDNVQISEGPVPVCAQVRAVDHERERSKALVLRERANPVQHAPPTATGEVPWMPQLPVAEAPSVPALLDRDHLPVPEKLEEAPRPNPMANAPQAKTFEMKRIPTPTTLPAVPAAPQTPALPPLPSPQLPSPGSAPALPVTPRRESGPPLLPLPPVTLQ